MKLLFVLLVAVVYEAHALRGYPETQILQCMPCLKVAATGGQRRFCDGSTCGDFGITWAYWSDAGKFSNTENGQVVDYAGCALDNHCSTATVLNYILKFHQDCNGDGIINCDDYALIHFNGGYGCRNTQLQEPFLSRFRQCRLVN